MARERKNPPGFMIYFDSLDIFTELDDSQFREVILAAARFSRDGDEEITKHADQCVRMALRGLLPKLAADRERYIQKIEQTTKAGNAAAENRKNDSLTAASADDSQRPQADADDRSLKTTIKTTSAPSHITDVSGKRFAPPTHDEVRAYMAEYAGQKGLQVDPGHEAEQFRDYYDAGGWRVGQANRPMRNWQAAARRWLTNGFTSAPPARAAPVGTNQGISIEDLY